MLLYIWSLWYLNKPTMTIDVNSERKWRHLSNNFYQDQHIGGWVMQLPIKGG